jgi:hypothetical protein
MIWDVRVWIFRAYKQVTLAVIVKDTTDDT